VIWDNHTVQMLRDLWTEGYSTAEIGRRLGFSKNAIIGKAHRLDLDARPSPIRRDQPTLPGILPVLRGTGPTLPPLPSLARPAWNAKTTPPETRDIVAKMLIAGVSNVRTAESTGVKIDAVRKIRKTLVIPKRTTMSYRRPETRKGVDKAGQEMPVVFTSSTMDFTTSSRRGEIWNRNTYIKRTKLVGKLPTSDDIAAFIAKNGVTQCPTAASWVTTASIPTADSVALVAYRQKRIEEVIARDAPRLARAAAANRRTAAMRR
jgi:hypothetical protein